MEAKQLKWVSAMFGTPSKELQAVLVQTKDGKQKEAHYDRRARSWTTVGGETARQINDVKFWAIKPPEQPETH